VDLIKGLAQQYYPKVMTNITVGGVQQVLLHLKVYEVSRTKLRTLGFDFTLQPGGGFLYSGVSGLVDAATGGVASGANPTMAFRIVDGGSSFFGILEALRRDDLIKLMSEPTLVTYSGRPAYFKVGGKIPYPVSQGFGAVQVQWEEYGTKVDFVPIVLGNGQVRLEVRPDVSEIDDTRSPFQGIPAFKNSVVDTGVEIGTGQTLAIAGLVQRRIEAQKKAIPVVGEVPYFGAIFSTKREQLNEIETLVLVTPELVDPMNHDEVPPCLPGMRTTSPTDWDLYLKGFLEVPNPCPPCNGPQCIQRYPGQPAQPTLPPGADPQSVRPIPQGANGVDTRSGQRPVTAASYTTRATAGAVRNSASSGRYNPSSPSARSPSPGAGTKGGDMPGFLGPVGYEAAE
jgi:pilus assembly protein CpaC